MKPKYDVGDRLFITGRVEEIHISADEILYKLQIKTDKRNMREFLIVPEEELAFCDDAKEEEK